jgi:GNAT superfamily N-acetyltransferase
VTVLRSASAARHAAPPAIRPATTDDLIACAHVWRDALADYLARLNQPVMLGDLEPVRRLLAHLLATDPDMFLVATRAPDAGVTVRDAIGANGERIVGFGSATVRGRSWFLAMLFVAPDEQASGLGARLLERTFPPGRRPASRGADGPDAADGWTFGTVTDSAQPISNALYARLGLVPRVPMLHLAGEVRRPSGLPRLPTGMDGVPFDELVADDDSGRIRSSLEVAIGELDRELLGYEHPQDHAFLRTEKRLGVLYRDRDGLVAGYGYTSRLGRVGPVAVRDPRLLPAVLGHLLHVVRPAGAFSTWVPGAAGDAVSVLLDAGLRLELFPALHCWDRPSVDDTRYVPITMALL